MDVGSLSILSSAFTVPVTDSQQDTATVSNDAYPFFFINFIPFNYQTFLSMTEAETSLSWLPFCS